MILVLAVSVARPAGAQPSIVAGLVAPESVFFDPGTKSWFVSNFGPMRPLPDSKDDDGFISRIDATTGVMTEHWVDGLGSPKGVRSRGGKLYVADVDTLVVIDIASAKILQRIKLPGASILNDVDVDKKGNAYVTDWTGNRIYKVSATGKPSVLVASPMLEAPNGILVEGNTLTIAAWGTNINPTLGYSTDEPGRILKVDIARKTIKPLGSGVRIAGLDGIERDGNSYLVTDWAGGRLLRVAMDGSFTTEMQLGPSSADLGFDRATRTVGVPIFAASVAVFETLGP